VTGFATESSCQKWQNWQPMLSDPTALVSCKAERMPGPHPAGDDWEYDPKLRPDGKRCSLQDYQVNEFGTRPDGFANRPYDNVGVQYGLAALRAGQITTEQFVALNVGIGGIDINGQWTPYRTEADPDALRRAYQNGRVVNGALLAKVPIVSFRASDPEEYHSDVEDQILSSRLMRDTGSRDNQVILVTPKGSGNAAASTAFLLMDQWLSALFADRAHRQNGNRVAETKPVGAVDTCYIDGGAVTSQKTCRKSYPYYSKPRLVAGAPMTDDVLKCQLRPLNRADYPADLTPTQFAMLQRVFPQGVCDYSLLGVAQAPPIGQWLDYSHGPDATPLGRPPQSKPWTAPKK
jgi:hypothetical protein